jgi:hypothetical protein
MSVYSFFDTSFGAMRERLRAAASKFLVSLWEDRSGNTDLRPLYARPGAEMVRERMDGMERPRDSSRDPQF